MDAKTLEALEGSIEKWEKNAQAQRSIDATLLAADCPLCDLFCSTQSEGICTGCPVFMHTGESSCLETPYHKANRLHSDWHFGLGDGSEFRAAAREEVAFLKSLLPEATQ